MTGTVVVCDTEAVSLLSPNRRHDPRRVGLMALIEEASAVLVPQAVRVEALAPRNAAHADLNRLNRDAERSPCLRGQGGQVADLAAEARVRLGTEVAVVDAIVGASASVLAAGSHRVEVATSDPGDLDRIVRILDARVAVIRI